jgi:hypothetical protein
VPVDICVKGMLIAAWKTWRENAPAMPVSIYNASSLKKASFFSLKANNVIDEYPPMQAIMYQDHWYIKCRFIGWVIRIVEQIIPALIIDGLLTVVGEKTK